MTSFPSQLNGKYVLPGHIIVLTMSLGFVGPANNIQNPQSASWSIFSEHKSCQKHIGAFTNKSNINKLLAKGNKEIKDSQGKIDNQHLIKKFIKRIYFLAKKKWAVKNNFEGTI